MTWWRWNNEEKFWQPTLVPPDAAFVVGDHTRLLPVGSARHWALLTADAAATVNGRPCLPIEILDDRDEVRLTGDHFCLSTHSPADPLAFSAATAANRNVRCARCQSDLLEGDRVVRCGHCRAYHHASCESYDARCQKCGLPMSGPAWMPDPVS
jgi:hypothetical protein